MAYAGRTVKKRKQIPALDELSPKQQAFIRHLKESEEFDTTEAATKAGYKNPAVQGSRLANHPTVRDCVRRWQEARERRTNITADKIVQELANLAFSDPTELCDENGNLNAENIKKLDAGTRKLIDNFKQKTRIYTNKGKKCRDIEMEVSTITSGTRLRALELLMKHIGEGEKHTHEHNHNFNWDEYYRARAEETDYVSVQLKRLEFEEARNPPQEEEPIDTEYSIRELTNGEMA